MLMMTKILQFTLMLGALNRYFYIVCSVNVKSKKMFAEESAFNLQCDKWNITHVHFIKSS